MKIVNYIRKKNSKINYLFDNNIDSILLYNSKMFSTIILVSIIVMFIPILFSPFSISKSKLIPLYALSIVLFTLLYFLFQLNPLKKRPLIGIYLVFIGAFLFSIFLSVINSQEQRATIILGFFCIFPMCIIDKPYRYNLFSIVFYIIHTVLSFIIKGKALGLDDAINCFCFLALGIMIGNQMIKIRLDAFETKKQLITEKETDILTGLKNRRKLFQMINGFDKNDKTTPSGVIMMDLDNFKNYNDLFGHTAGDQLLSEFGRILLDYEKKYNLQFFRYGGEEFAGLSWLYDLNELQNIFESLKLSVNNISNCYKEVRVSIGITNCEAKNSNDYDKYLDLADKALYIAKATGKNKVVCFDPTKDYESSEIEWSFSQEAT